MLFTVSSARIYERLCDDYVDMENRDDIAHTHREEPRDDFFFLINNVGSRNFYDFNYTLINNGEKNLLTGEVESWETRDLCS